MTNLANLKVFTTHPHECSYLEGQEATTLFIDPQADIDQWLFSRLSEGGFRRSGAHIYKPQCRHCDACLPSRVAVADFVPNRTQRKLLARNSDLDCVELSNIDNDACYLLYQDYICQRHADGDMYPPSREQFRAFLTRQWDVTRYYGYRLDGELLAVAVVDQLDDALSAVYTFFAPADTRRSLGTWVILHQIQLARTLGLDYLYLGYWIRESRKMAYKNSFQPLQILHNQRWQRADSVE